MVCPSGAWFENRPHSTPSIHLAWNSKHVIVQWVGIGTHTHTQTYIQIKYVLMDATSVRFFWNYTLSWSIPGATRSKVPTEAVLTECSYAVLSPTSEKQWSVVQFCGIKGITWVKFTGTCVVCVEHSNVSRWCAFFELAIPSRMCTTWDNAMVSQRKNPEYDFLRKGTKAMGPVS